jgi:hypothetical protein
MPRPWPGGPVSGASSSRGQRRPRDDDFAEGAVLVALSGERGPGGAALFGCAIVDRC